MTADRYETIEQFAEMHRLKTRKDECGDYIVSGRVGSRNLDSHIYENGDGKLGVCLMFDSPRKWTNAKAKLLAAGFIIRQDGDSEGTALFNPSGSHQAKVAIRLARGKPRRELTPERIQVIAERFKRARELETAPLAGHLGAVLATQEHFSWDNAV